jgi:hypothetical protein
MPVIPAHRRKKQEHLEFKAILSYILETLSHKKQKKKKRKGQREERKKKDKLALVVCASIPSDSGS